jgi:arylsulfatase A-like enzyme
MNLSNYFSDIGKLLWALVVVFLVWLPGCYSTEKPDQSTQDILPPKKEVSHVFLVVYDTLRADHLGGYRYVRRVSPCLDKFAASSTVFTSAVSLSSWTRPSTISLLTSIRSTDHELGYHFSKISPEMTSLATVFRKAGFETHGFSANEMVSKRSGFDIGFDNFKQIGRFSAVQSTTKLILDEVHKSLRKDKRQFYYLHFLGPHGPYCPSSAARKRMQLAQKPEMDQRICEGVDSAQWYRADSDKELEYLKDLYDAEINEEDTYFCQLLSILKSSKVLDNSLIVFTSDHGEAFKEHGLTEHGDTLFHEEIHVPLMFHGPGISTDTRNGVVGLHDVAPSILAFAGLEFPKSFQGADILIAPHTERPVLLREFQDTKSESDGEIYGIIFKGKKALWGPGFKNRLLFENWNKDAIGLNQAVAQPKVMQQMIEDFKLVKKVKIKKSKMKMDSGEIKALKSLGYVKDHPPQNN